MRRKVLACIGVVLLLTSTGCAQRNLALPPSPDELREATTGTFAVVPARFLPELQTRTDTTSRALGALRGAGVGFLAPLSAGGYCTGDFCGPVLLFLLGVAGVGATVGTAVGAFYPVPVTVTSALDPDAQRAVVTRELQGGLAHQVLVALQVRASHRFTLLSGLGPTRPGEAVDYRPVTAEGVTAVLEVGLTRVGFQTSDRPTAEGETPPLRFGMTAKVKLMRPVTGEVLYEQTEQHVGESLPLAEWTADGGQRLLAAVEQGQRDLAQQVAQDLFGPGPESAPANEATPDPIKEE